HVTACGLLLLDALPIYAGAAVFRGDVVTAQIVDELAERAKQRRAIELRARPDDHALAATQRESRDRRLVGHAACQPQRVRDRLRSEEHTSELQSRENLV